VGVKLLSSLSPPLLAETEGPGGDTSRHISLENEDWGCKKVMGVWNIEAQRAEVERRMCESRGAEGVGVWGGGVPSPLGKRCGEGAVLLPRNFFEFRSPNGDFRCILVVFSYNSAACFTGAFGLPKFAVAIHCCLPS